MVHDSFPSVAAVAAVLVFPVFLVLFLVSSTPLSTAVRTMPMVHEPVQQRASEQKEPRKSAEQMSSMLLPQKEQRHRGKYREAPAEALVVDCGVGARRWYLVRVHATQRLQP